MHVRPPSFGSNPSFGISVPGKHIHCGPRLLLLVASARPFATAPGPFVRYRVSGSRLGDTVHFFERKEFGGVIDAGGDCRYSRYGKDTGKNLEIRCLVERIEKKMGLYLHFHRHKVGHYEPWTVDKTDVWSPEECLEMLCLWGVMIRRKHYKRIRPFPEFWTL